VAISGVPDRKLERIGHRGAPRRFLENTLPSFAEALRLGADAIELDVHVTADGVPVVHHDPTLSPSVAPAELRRRAISDLTAAQARSADLGSGGKIPLLADVLKLVAGRITTYVEIKAGEIEPVVKVITESGATCAIHSFDHAAVADAKRVAPNIPRGALLDRWPPSLEWVVTTTGARDVWPKATLLTEERIKQIHQLGCRAIAWTVNDKALARQLDGWEIDAICTDDLTVI
jgi:glycerophosphoryl diester phosphodiesterase